RGLASITIDDIAAIDEIAEEDIHVTLAELELRDSGTNLVHGPRSHDKVAAELAEKLASMLAPALAKLPDAQRGSPSEIATVLSKALAASSDELGSLFDRLGPGAQQQDGFSGTIELIPLAEILQVLQLQRQTGTCRIDNGDVEITVWFRDGLVDLARGRGTA